LADPLYGVALTVGAHPWHYFVTYQEDLNEALQLLREWEFLAGRYRKHSFLRKAFGSFIVEDGGEINPRKTAMNLIDKYGGVEEAISAVADASGDCGTASILDMFRIADTEDDCAVCPLQPSEMMDIFGTLYPSVHLVKSVLIREATDGWAKFWESIERGTGRYVFCYEDKIPIEIFFAGYSFD
jgi:hypothetical protein